MRASHAPLPAAPELVVRTLGLADYLETWRAMQDFTGRRGRETRDEIWLLEHPPVYTLGLNAPPRNHAGPPGIPVVRTDRGGDISYHGPGQLVAYVLMDLKRRGWGVKQLVTALEQSVIELLRERGIAGERRLGAPGVYVAGRKLAQLGLRIRRGSSYHGLALNVDMDLAPFHAIDPCGHAGLEVTQLAELLPRATDGRMDRTADALGAQLVRALGYPDADPVGRKSA